jgi:hypothetical protein
MAHGFAIFMGHVGALHSLRSFRRSLPWALGNTNFQAKLAIGFHLFRHRSREQFFIPKPLQAHHRPGVCTGPALRSSLPRQGAHVQGSSLLSVLRQPALTPAAPKCHSPQLCRAARPLAASVGFCAVASHRADIPQPRLAPSLLGVFAVAGYSGLIASSVTTNIQVGSCL